MIKKRSAKYIVFGIIVILIGMIGYFVEQTYYRGTSLGLTSCNDKLYESKDVSVWETRLVDEGFKVYSVTQFCELNNGFKTVTFKIDAIKLPVAMALFDTKNELMRNVSFECRGLGGEGAHLYVKRIIDEVIMADCPSGHISAVSGQTYEIDYNTFEYKLIKDE